MVKEVILVKPFWKSKTLWYSALVVAIGVVSWANGQVESGLPITLLGVLTAALRVATKKGLIK